MDDDLEINTVLISRDIRFDDGERSLFLNVKFPEEDSWTRIDPSFAREVRDEENRSDAARQKLGGFPSSGSRSAASTPPSSDQNSMTKGAKNVRNGVSSAPYGLHLFSPIISYFKRYKN